MKILSLSIDNKKRNLIIHPIDFKDLTLLVGVSGVGKTQIIKSILSLKKVSEGESINGLNWNIHFETINGNSYIWKGAFEIKADLRDEFIDDFEDNSKNKPNILSEELLINGDSIVKRTNNEIIFKGSPTVKLSQKESVISLLKEEELISDVNNAFKKVVFSDQSESKSEPFRLTFFNTSKLESKYKTLESIQELDEDIRTKLFLAYKNAPTVFEKIKSRFIEVFPQVEDIKIAPLENNFSDILNLLKEHPFIQIKEIGIDDWIHQGQISSGMFRTLLHISEMYLSAKGTVILIDEFENSLGINCIDELTSDLINSRDHQIQFIITSHHPYIINNIDYTNWKIVTRKAGNIKTFNASDLNIGKSKHEAFIQLINIDKYTSGIDF